jgi:hypothetical protein
VSRSLPNIVRWALPDFRLLREVSESNLSRSSFLREDEREVVGREHVVAAVSTRSRMARSYRCVLGRACPLCPGISDVDLFSYREGIIDLDTEVSNGAFDFGVA